MPRVKAGAAVRTMRHGTVLPPVAEGIAEVPAEVVPLVHRRPLGDTAEVLFPLVLDAAALARLDPSTAAEVLARFAAWGGNGVAVSDVPGSQPPEGTGLVDRRSRERRVLIGRFGAVPSAARSPRALVARVEEALRRLGTDRFDVLALSPDAAGRLDELLSAVEVLVARGLTRAVVASGFAAEELFEARVLAAHGLPRFAAVEVRYSLLEHGGAEGDLGLVAAGQGLSLLSTGALAHGFLRGVERTRRELGRLPDGDLAAAHLGRRGRRVRTALDAIGTELSAAPAAVALAWLLMRPGLAAATVAPRSASDVDALVRALSLDLDDGHLAALDRARR